MEDTGGLSTSRGQRERSHGAERDKSRHPGGRLEEGGGVGVWWVVVLQASAGGVRRSWSCSVSLV